MGRGYLTIFRGCIAVLAIYIAVVSRIPTSHCRCHEKKPVEQTTKKKCPFGELRLLAQVALLSEVVAAPDPDFISVPFDELAPISYVGLSVRHIDARAPPHRLA